MTFGTRTSGSAAPGTGFAADAAPAPPMPAQPLTKIVATLGPASSGAEVIDRLVVAGVSVFRLNFSHGTLEDHRTAIRNIRRDANDQLKKSLKNKEISEDEEFRGLSEVQKITDQFIEQVDELAKQKEKEVMEV